MTRVPLETVDEVIDRVAARLTDVPAEPDFSARLQSRLEQPSLRSTPLLVVASAVAAIVAAVVVTDRIARDDRARMLPAASAPVAGPAAVPGRVVEPHATAIGSSAPALEVAAVRPHVTWDQASDPAERVVRMIDALATPDVLNVDNLTLAELAIEPVDVEFLDVPTLEVRELDATLESKE